MHADQRNARSGVQCNNCNKFGHIKANCWYRVRKHGSGVNVAAEMEHENNTTNLFLTSSIEEGLDGAVWLVDNGRSNHMTSMRSLFNDLDETYKEKVYLGDNKELAVEGKGTVSFHTNGGKVKLLHGVQFVPTLAHNLLSVGQLISHGYSVIFELNHCLIKDGQT
ncbi:RNA-directed DNA polymerase protein [Dioscorea alata]|uniref:RNA-directed DNA polymerase protein n=1 Tax=Dioscorea alata TaxID=55571 RepID=A0ACB7TTV4_DIOAL|nr:RNA-directed DNA polymerase protein [Dioscorea alata]